MSTEHLDLPLRGLSSADIAPTLDAWLRGVAGVLGVELRASEFVVHVTYDPSQTTPAAIRARLRAFSGSDDHEPVDASRGDL